MSDMEFHDYELTVYCNVMAPSQDEAQAAIERSGIVPGTVIGEVLVETYDLDER